MAIEVLPTKQKPKKEKKSRSSRIPMEMNTLENVPNQMDGLKKFMIFLIYVLLVIMPIGQMISAIEFWHFDKTRVTLFLASNSVFQFVAMGLFILKIKQNISGKTICYIAILPIIYILSLGIAIWTDYNCWKSSFGPDEQSYCNSFVFIFGYIMNIINYLCFAIFASMTILRHFGLGCTKKPTQMQPFFCCQEVICGGN